MIAGHSSFSAEDLVSNLIGFFSAYRNMALPQMRRLCGEVSMAESYRLWNEHLPNGFGGLRSRTLRPILFPGRECADVPSDTTFPAIFNSIRPADEGALWTRLRDRFVSGALLYTNRTVRVSDDGRIVRGR